MYNSIMNSDENPFETSSKAPLPSSGHAPSMEEDEPLLRRAKKGGPPPTFIDSSGRMVDLSATGRRMRYLVFAAAVATRLLISLLLFYIKRTPTAPSSSSSSSAGAWTVRSTNPHIIMFYADDQGWNDIGYQSEDLFAATPHLDALAAGGIKLTGYYGMPVCTPSRAALLTGMYTIHTGMQHSIVTSNHPYALPLDLTIMPQYLKALGYATHMVGKWHLGHFKKEHLPLARGFDSHVGFWSGFQDCKVTPYIRPPE